MIALFLHSLRSWLWFRLSFCGKNWLISKLVPVSRFISSSLMLLNQSDSIQLNEHEHFTTRETLKGWNKRRRLLSKVGKFSLLCAEVVCLCAIWAAKFAKTKIPESIKSLLRNHNWGSNFTIPVKPNWLCKSFPLMFTYFML